MRWRNAKKVKVDKVLSPSLFIVASPLSRLKAFTVDSFMLLMPILYVVFYVIFGSRELFREHMIDGWLLVLVPHFMITTFFLLFKGQTPGYKAYDIQLIDIKSKTLKKASLMQLFSRYFLFLLTTATLFGLFVPLFRKDKLSLFDLLSHTAPIESLKSDKK